MSYNIYTGILKALNNFSNSNSEKLKLKYESDTEISNKLNEKYNIIKVAGNGTDLSKTLNLLHWLSKNTYHKGDFMNETLNNPLDLLEFSYANGAKSGINCVGLATILTECLYM